VCVCVCSREFALFTCMIYVVTCDCVSDEGVVDGTEKKLCRMMFCKAQPISTLFIHAEDGCVIHSGVMWNIGESFNLERYVDFSILR